MTAVATQPKVQEIEDLADELERVTLEAKSWAEKKKDATENLVASMRRHGVLSYGRSTWGLVTVEDGKPKVKVKLAPKAVAAS
jgi:hypothetical protein